MGVEAAIDEKEALPLPMTVERDEFGRVVFEPDGRVLRGFMLSDARVRIIRGPIRSGDVVGVLSGDLAAGV